MLNVYYEHTLDKVDGNVDMALNVAWAMTKDNWSEPATAKSLTMSTANPSHSGNFIEVMMGTPKIDADGDYLDFWQNLPVHPIAGDMEHSYLEGNFKEEDFEGFVPKADSFFNKDDGSMWAKVELPDHKFTPEFKKRWDSGEYGVSIEFDYPDRAISHEIVNGDLVRKISEGIVTGFSFTTNPAITETKLN